VVTTAAGVVLAKDTDYSMLLDSDPDGISTITRLVPATPKTAEGELVSVSYAYSDQSYFTPQAFSDFITIEQIYGSALKAASTGSSVNSPMSLAARIAFENGAPTVLCLPVDPAAATLRDGFHAAYAKLSEDYDTTLLVAVFTSPDGDAEDHTASVPGLLSDLKVHCEGQAALGYGRIGFAGVDTVYDETTIDGGLDDLAAGVNSSRVFLTYPTRMNLYNNVSGQTVEVGGCYLAAALAGILTGGPVNRGFTQSQVYGFNGIPSPVKVAMSTSAKNTLSSSGVSVVEPSRSSTLRVRHGISTNPSSLVTSEVSITRTFDILYQLALSGLQDANLIGDPIDDDMSSRVQGILIGILEGAKASLVIREWLNLVVRQQTLEGGDPTVIECIFTYRPFLPLNYIMVVFTMDLATGSSTVNTLTAG
jgi:hypothetical protein